MRGITWALVAIAGAGVAAAVFTRVAVESPEVAEMVSAWEPTTPAGRDTPSDRAIPEMQEDGARAMPAETPDLARIGARIDTIAAGTEPLIGTPIEEELRWTEQALAASRRISDPEPAGRHEPVSSASRQALAAAAAGSSAAALGCGGAGHTCLSSAECCPSLACAGGVAGYGTAGRCEVAR